MQVASWQVAYQWLVLDALLSAMSVTDWEPTWRQLLGEGVRVLIAQRAPAAGSP